LKCQALVIAGTKDLVFDGSHSWKNISKEKIQAMKEKEEKWTQEQEKLLDLGVSKSEIHALQRSSQMVALIEKLKLHSGPLNSDAKIDEFLTKQKQEKTTDVKVATMLNLELKFRRDANLRFSLSNNSYLYKQRKITNDEKIKNLRILVRWPEAKSTATLDDLRHLYTTLSPPESACEKENESFIQPSENVHDLVANGPWPPIITDHLAVKTGEGWTIGEVSELKDSTAALLRLFERVEIPGFEQFSLWQDRDGDLIEVSKTSVLPARPLTDVVPSLSTMTKSRRKIIFQLENYMIIDSLVMNNRVF
jgi:hypothetical protein